MTTSAKTLGIDKLSLPERILLVEEIWDSIADEADALEVPQWHEEELARRLAAHDADPKAGSAWPEVKARILKGGAG